MTSFRVDKNSGFETSEIASVNMADDIGTNLGLMKLLSGIPRFLSIQILGFIELDLEIIHFQEYL